MSDAARIAASLAQYGLSLRGGFNFSENDRAPAAVSGQPAKAVLLVGNVGAAFWPHFERWRQAQIKHIENPLDSWSRMVIQAAGELVGARTVLPNDRPFLPFQQWAMRSEGLRPSPLGMLMHPQYGLWHAYRGALLFDTQMLFEEISASAHPCDDCREKPCLGACPVNAHGSNGFDYTRCLDHVRGETGGSCGTVGCHDRNACPVGTSYRYPLPVQAFFMKAFAGL